MLTTRTPLRISLVGGGTDMPSFYKKHTGAVISFTINKYVYVSINKKFDGKLRVSYSKTENVDSVDDLQHELVRESLKLFNIKSGLEITSISDIPGSGTGLGSSSAFTVGLLKALGTTNGTVTLAERAFTVEADKCSHPVGKQDHYSAAFGGLNYFVFGKNKVEHNPIMPSIKMVQELQSHSLLLWTGITRDANEILKNQNKTFLDGGNIEIGKQLSRLADDLYVEMSDGIEMERIGEYLQKAWQLKKFLAQSITNSKVDAWYEKAIWKGAYGGKLLGAGGGGFMYFLAHPKLHDSIVEETGLRKVEFKLDYEGSQVIYES